MAGRRAERVPPSVFGGPALVSMTSAEGRRLLHEAGTVDHGPLLRWFEGQERLCFCSVASSVITLNALRDDEHHAQAAFFGPEISAIRTEAEVDLDGMTLPDLAMVLATCGAKVTVRHAADETLEEFREAAVANLHRDDDFMIVNYQRSTFEQAGGGHFSPLAAWHEGTDRFLVLDVADRKYPPVWMSARRLYAAMATIDPSSGRSRGYLSLSL